MSAARAVAPAVLGVALAVLAPALEAGTACSERPLTADEFRAADRLARELRDVLDRDAGEAAILGRVGADLSRYGLRFSHAGVVIREGAHGPWRVVHVLNHCGRPTSALYREGLINFFLDDPFEYAVLVLVPGARTQRRLAEEIAAGTGRTLFEPRYDMLAYPDSLRAANSDQWLLELIAAAQAPPGRVRDRAAAHDWLDAHGYRADVVRVSALERLGARLLRANVSFEDQPPSELLAGRVHVVTVHSIARYLEAAEPRLVREILSVPMPRYAVRARSPVAPATAADARP